MFLHEVITVSIPRPRNRPQQTVDLLLLSFMRSELVYNTLLLYHEEGTVSMQKYKWTGTSLTDNFINQNIAKG